MTNAAAQQQQGQYCTREDGEAVRLRRHVNALARHMRNDRRKLKLAKFDRLRMVSLAAQLNEKLSRANGMLRFRGGGWGKSNQPLRMFIYPLGTLGKGWRDRPSPLRQLSSFS